VAHIGNNNIYALGSTADEETKAIQRLFTLMHGKLPNSKIYYFGITQRKDRNDKKAV